MLDNIKGSKKLIGFKQSIKALKNGSVISVYIAKDIENHLYKEIYKLCEVNKVKMVEIESMAKLGKASNLKIGASVVSILKDD